MAPDSELVDPDPVPPSADPTPHVDALRSRRSLDRPAGSLRRPDDDAVMGADPLNRFGGDAVIDIMRTHVWMVGA